MCGGDGDSLDRERVRDILLEEYNYKFVGSNEPLTHTNEVPHLKQMISNINNQFYYIGEENDKVAPIDVKEIY